MKALQIITVGVMLLLLQLNSCLAQNYPSKPIRMIHAVGTGASSDIIGRFLASTIGVQLGRPVVVENIPGAGGTIGMTTAAKAVADGHTLVMITEAQAVAQNLYRQFSYRLIEDFSPITQFSTGYFIALIHPQVPAKSVKELVDLAKAKPGQLNYATAGNGTGIHLAAALFKSMAAVDIVHVPFKGTGPGLTALLGGQVELMFLGVPSSRDLIRAGKLRALGITASKRSSSFPELPTIGETVSGYEMTTWQGVAAPVNTPHAIIEKLHDTYVRLLQAPEVRAKFQELGVEGVGSSSESFSGYIKAEVGRYGEAVRASGMPIE